jgi:hypothetical protein
MRPPYSPNAQCAPSAYILQGATGTGWHFLNRPDSCNKRDNIRAIEDYPST